MPSTRNVTPETMPTLSVAVAVTVIVADTVAPVVGCVIATTGEVVSAGAGVVADSDPTSEYQETVSKAMGLLKALEIAETQL